MMIMISLSASFSIVYTNHTKNWINHLVNEPIATRNIDYYNNLFHDRLNSLNEIQTNYENDDDFYDEWNNDQNDSFFEPSISMNSPFYYNTIAIQSNYNSEQNNCPSIKPTEQTKDLHHPMKFNSFESSTPSTILSKPKYKQVFDQSFIWMNIETMYFLS